MKFGIGPFARAVALCSALGLPGAGWAQDETAALSGARAAAAQEGAQTPAPEPMGPVQIAIAPTQPWLVGFSGFHTDDGHRFVAVTNFGFVVEGVLQRDRSGRLTGFQPTGARPLSFPDGRALTNGYRAAEGLAVARDGRLFVSFEYHTRVWTYRSAAARPEDLGVHRDFERLPNGRGLASLAMAPSGALYAIPERPARMTHGFPSYRWQNGEWVGSFRMPSDGGFLPVDADFGPDGLLYVLEHQGAPQGGQSQIRRFAVQGDRMARGTVVMRSHPGQFGNLSGLSVWRDRAGRLRATMVADNGGTTGRAGAIVEAVLPR